MRKRMTVILALVVGVFLGYAARDLPISEYIASGGDGNEVASATATVSVSGQPAGVVGNATPPEPLPEVHPFPAADMYLDYVLPERALIQWKICAGDIRDNTGEDSLSSLAKRDALRNLFASLSQGPGPSFAPFIAELAAQADTIQIFLMPPDGQLPTLTFLLAATWPEVSYADLRKCLREPICAGLENGNPYGKPTGEFVVEGVSSNTGNVSYAVTEGMVWVCNSPIVLEQTLTMPPPPKPETDPPTKELLGHVPQDGVTAVFNLRDQGGSAGPAGFLALLKQWGIEQMAVGWGGKQPSLVAYGRFGRAPEWINSWPSLDATDVQAPSAGTLLTLDISLPTIPGATEEFRGRSDRGPDRMREGGFGDRQQMGGRHGGFRQGSRFGLDRRIPMMMRMLPPAERLSLRVAVGEQEPILWAAAFRGDPLVMTAWLDTFLNSPGIETEDLSASAVRVVLGGGMYGRIWGLSEAILVDNDGTLNVYSTEEALRYLSVPTGGSGQVVMETQSSESSDPRRMCIQVSAEFLKRLIEGEIADVGSATPNAKAVADFLRILADLTTPVTADLRITEEGMELHVEAKNHLAAVIGPAFIASSLMRGRV